MALRRGRKKTANRKIMLVEGNSTIGDGVVNTINTRGHKVVWASSTDEALSLLRDAVYIGSSFDALLADHDLSGTSALRVIRDFRNEFKMAHVGLMARQGDIATAIWANSKGIPILEKPLHEHELVEWLSQVERHSDWAEPESVPA